MAPRPVVFTKGKVFITKEVPGEQERLLQRRTGRKISHVYKSLSMQTGL